MKFVNRGEPRQVRESDGIGRFKWKCVKKGESIDLPLNVGKAYGFIMQLKATEIQVGRTKAETKQIDDTFSEELQKIKGIGKNTAKDIINIFKTKEQLIYHINHDDELPVRNDVEKILRGAF